MQVRGSGARVVARHTPHGRVALCATAIAWAVALAGCGGGGPGTPASNAPAASRAPATIGSSPDPGMSIDLSPGPRCESPGRTIVGGGHCCGIPHGKARVFVVGISGVLEAREVGGQARSEVANAFGEGDALVLAPGRWDLRVWGGARIGEVSLRPGECLRVTIVDRGTGRP